uniref:Putative ovule protein n=1 Tax=Solanum chacoense TaxID=4108 RepID=A0A0V0H0D2_SOLCH
MDNDLQFLNLGDNGLIVYHLIVQKLCHNELLHFDPLLCTSFLKHPRVLLRSRHYCTHCTDHPACHS